MDAQSRSTQLTKVKYRKESEGNADRISYLDDDLRLHILSFLKMDDVIRTSLVSKRWRNLWKCVTCLDFKYVHLAKHLGNDLEIHTRWFIRFVDKSLSSHLGSKIQKLRVCFFGEDPCQTVEIGSWLHFAITHNVEELSLDLGFDENSMYPFYRSHPSYKLPHSLLNCRSLTAITLGSCDLNLPKSFHLAALKLLTLKMLNVSGDEIKHLTSSCPQLQSFVLDGCNLNEDLNIVIENQNLKFVEVYEWYGTDFQFQICAPYLVSLSFHYYMTRTEYCLKNLSSLTKIDFDDLGSLFDYDDEYIDDKWVRILGELIHVKELHLCSAYIKVLWVWGLRRLKSFTINATCMKLKSTLGKWDLPAISYLLRNSPALQNLTLQRDYPSTFDYDLDFEEKGFWENEEFDWSSVMQKLEIVEIYLCNGTNRKCYVDKNLGEFQNKYEFVKFVLKNSKALKKMILTIGGNTKNYELLYKLTKKLIVLPRASSSAEVYII